MNLLEMVDKLEILRQEAEAMVDSAKTELRKLNDEEDVRYNQLISDIKNLEKQIADEKAADIRNNKNVTIKTEVKMNEKFNLLNASSLLWIFRGCISSQFGIVGSIS